MTKKPKSQSDDKVSHLQEQNEDLQNKYLRALADYQNLENRTQQHVQDSEKRIKKGVLLSFLEVLDNVEKAEIFVKDSGLSMIKSLFIKALSDHNVKEMDLLGKPYNPEYAEAIDIQPGDTDNIVLEVARKGYMIGNDVLRTAHVVVSKKTTE